MTTKRVALSAIMAIGLLAIGLGSLAAGQTAAQPYPSRPIKMVVPFAPGGADVIARLVADQLTAGLGQPVVIENRPGGAGGTVGTKFVTTAEPDGYTLTLASPGPITVAPAVYKNLDYDPIKQLAPVAMIATSPFVLVINPAVPATTVRELVAYAKANPGKINFVSPGFGTSSHLFGELLKQRTGVEIVHVPYRGATPAIVDLVAGQVQMFFDNVRNVQSFIQAGKLRVLAVTSETRSPDMPDLPTMAEAGVDGFVGIYWNGVLAPAGTPASIIDRLNAVINEGLRSREMQANLAKLGMEPKSGSPQDLATHIAVEFQRWTAVARAANF
jgi:tripartite-type tricarboxylate transporter receptor subunit TctC